MRARLPARRHHAREQHGQLARPGLCRHARQKPAAAMVVASGDGKQREPMQASGQCFRRLRRGNRLPCSDPAIRPRRCAQQAPGVAEDVREEWGDACGSSRAVDALHGQHPNPNPLRASRSVAPLAATAVVETTGRCAWSPTMCRRAPGGGMTRAMCISLGKDPGCSSVAVPVVDWSGKAPHQERRRGHRHHRSVLHSAPLRRWRILSDHRTVTVRTSS